MSIHPDREPSGQSRSADPRRHHDARPTPNARRNQMLWQGALGAFLGASFEGGSWGFVSGAGLGVLLAETRALRRELTRLEDARRDPLPAPEELAGRERVPEPAAEAVTPVAAVAEARLAPESPAPESQSPETKTREVPEETSKDAPKPPRATPDRSRVQEWSPRERPPIRGAARASSSGAAPASSSEPSPTPSPTPSSRPGPSLLEVATARVADFLFRGNAVVRVGLLVLFVGLTLLAKYAVDNAYFPVEARLSAAALTGLGLVRFGYRQRESRPGFGMSLQGGGFAVLYLVTFFAFRVYGLIDATLAFSVFAGIAVATAVLATLQRSQALLVIGSLGGFAAPVLAATGSDQHVALFSYYLLLTCSIAAVAWWRAWRWPAWVAFVCVYGIATIWGLTKYEPERFSTTEPFLLAFLVVFTATAVMHAWRRPPELRGLIDGTLVFGTPFLSILFQAGLVRDFEFGLAKSAAGFAVFYAVLALGLRRGGPRELGLLVEAFVALAVGFATMAIPFAFEEGLTTATAWALEGAGLYWVGARQDRRLPRLAGIALQGLAGVACLAGLAWDSIDSGAFVPIANGRALSFLSLSLSGLFVAWRAEIFARSRGQVVLGWAGALGLWGLGWWTIGVITEVEQFVLPDFRLAAILGVAALSALALERIGSVLDWFSARRLALLVLPAAAMLLFAGLLAHPQLLSDGGWLAWILVFGTLVFLGARAPEAASPIVGLFRAGSFWLFAVFAGFAARGLVEFEAGLEADWLGAAFGSALAVALILGAGLAAKGRLRAGLALGPVALLCLATVVGLQFEAVGSAPPFRHWPILNPTDGAVVLLAAAIAIWARRVSAKIASDWAGRVRAAGYALAGAVAFLAINGTIARTVHQWTGVALHLDRLWDSSAFHMSISIIWTMLGLSAMWIASRRSWRPVWICAAALLSVVVLKLFLVDLAQLATVTRIGTFLAVGILLLVLGYLSPVPPGEEPEEPREGDSQAER